MLLTTEGTPKISDFGLARRLDDEEGLTWTGTAVGTPSYMAPEQAEAQPSSLGPAIDVYSLGAILYELLTGRPPFRAETPALTFRQMSSQVLVPPAQLNRKVPRDLEVICLKCLSHDPHLRYASAALLAQDLGHFQRGEAISARPAGVWVRAARQARRKPMRTGVIAVGIMSAVLLLAAGLWLLSERAAALRKTGEEWAAIEQAARDDVDAMNRSLKTSAWPKARAALERARIRLGERGSMELRDSLDQGDRELELASRLELIPLDAARKKVGVATDRADDRYEEAFSTSGIGRIYEDPSVVARRIQATDIAHALVGALDRWSSYAKDSRRKDWIFTVALCIVRIRIRQAGVTGSEAEPSIRTRRPS